MPKIIPQILAKEENIPVKYVLFGGPHLANYKGCSVHEKLQGIRSNSDKNTPVNRNYNIRENINYAQATEDDTLQNN